MTENFRCLGIDVPKATIPTNGQGPTNGRNSEFFVHKKFGIPSQYHDCEAKVKMYKTLKRLAQWIKCKVGGIMRSVRVDHPRLHSRRLAMYRESESWQTVEEGNQF